MTSENALYGIIPWYFDVDVVVRILYIQEKV